MKEMQVGTSSNGEQLRNTGEEERNRQSILAASSPRGQWQRVRFREHSSQWNALLAEGVGGTPRDF